MDETNRQQSFDHPESVKCPKPTPKEHESSTYDWFEDEPDRDFKRKGRQIGEAILEKLRR